MLVLLFATIAFSVELQLEPIFVVRNDSQSASSASFDGREGPALLWAGSSSLGTVWLSKLELSTAFLWTADVISSPTSLIVNDLSVSPSASWVAIVGEKPIDNSGYFLVADLDSGISPRTTIFSF